MRLKALWFYSTFTNGKWNLQHIEKQHQGLKQWQPCWHNTTGMPSVISIGAGFNLNLEEIKNKQKKFVFLKHGPLFQHGNPNKRI